MFTTGDVITTRLGIKFTEEELGNFPDYQKFTKAPEVKEIADQLIDRFKSELSNQKIAYVFKRTASKTKTGDILGSARRENDLSIVLHGYNGVIIIAWDKWVTMDKDQKARLVLHELCHYFPNLEKNILELVEHPVNEFPEVISIFGPGQETDLMFIEAYEKFKKDNSTLIDQINEERELKKQLEQ